MTASCGRLPQSDKEANDNFQEILQSGRYVFLRRVPSNLASAEEGDEDQDDASDPKHDRRVLHFVLDNTQVDRRCHTFSRKLNRGDRSTEETQAKRCAKCATDDR